MAEVGAAWHNGYAERQMRTIKEEEVELAQGFGVYPFCIARLPNSNCKAFS